jgi:6-phosphogluconolactonase/Glucosamine-6-phosphate isomerase/deaminase
MQTHIATDHQELSRETARQAAAFIRENPGSLLCLAAGDTPLGAFAELIKMQAAGEVDLSSVFYAGLDEWVGLGPLDKGSCRQVMGDNFYAPAGIPSSRIHIFDGLAALADPAAECAAMDAWLAARGGIGLTLLGVGMNGHIGFNEPNTPRSASALVVPLDETTRAVGVKYFDKPQPMESGITIGLDALRAARRVLVMASGAKKAPIIQRAFHTAPTPACPASLLQGHSDLTLLLDKGAAPSRD